MNLDPSYENKFQSLTSQQEAWLDVWHREGAKELTIEALRVCMDLVLPASSSAEIPHTCEAEQEAILKQWFGFCYGGTIDDGASYKEAMDANVLTAMQIHKRWKTVALDTAVRTLADSFLVAAQQQYRLLTTNGIPDGMRPWRRILRDMG